MHTTTTPTPPRPRPSSDAGFIGSVPPGGKFVALGFGEEEPNPRIPREGGDR